MNNMDTSFESDSMMEDEPHGTKRRSEDTDEMNSKARKVARFPCSQCGKGFSENYTRMRHEREVHGKKSHACDVCQKKYTRADYLRNHECVPRQREEVPSKGYVCADCGQFLKNMTGLKCHKRKCGRLCDRCGEPAITGHKKTCLQCEKCKKKFDSREAQREHVCSQGSKFQCQRCGKNFQDKAHLTRHLQSCMRCRHCQVTFASKQQLDEHKKTDHAATPVANKGKRVAYHCRYPNCTGIFEDRKSLLLHRLNFHTDPDHDLEDQFLWELVDTRVDENLKNVLRDNRHFIFAGHSVGEVKSYFRFPLVNCENWEEELQARVVDVVQKTCIGAVKVDACLGYVLDNMSKNYTYFSPGNNFPVLPRPRMVNSPADWTKLVGDLNSEYLTDQILQHRPESKDRLVMVTNAVIEVTSTGFNMGSDKVEQHVLDNRYIRALVNNGHGVDFEDKKCAFRCLAFHLLSGNDQTKADFPPVRPDDAQLEGKTDELWNKWGSLAGVPLESVPQFEDLFDIDLDIYELHSDGGVVPVYTSARKRPNRLALNLSGSHLSYITYLGGYLKSFKCSGCGKLFKREPNLRQHQGTCTAASFRRFNCGHYEPPRTIFEQLKLERIDVKHRLYSHFATFDSETYQMKNEKVGDGKTRKLRKHGLLCIGVSSNVEGFKDRICFSRESPQVLVEQMRDYLSEISQKASELAREKWGYVFDEIDDAIENRKKDLKSEVESSREVGAETQVVYEDEVDHFAEEEEEQVVSDKDPYIERMTKLRAKLAAYCDSLVILGFNSSNFDIGILKEHLIPGLGFFGRTADDWYYEHDEYGFVIKKGSSYTTIEANGLRFLDISQYLAPGTSYSNFLKAFGVEEAKSFLPYEFITGPEVMDHPELPPYEAFYSTIKRKNVLEEDGTVECGRKNYEELQKQWRDNGWSCFGDLIEHYQKQDVGPFVEAAENFMKFFFDMGVDCFKSSVSLPGISRRVLFDFAAKQGVSFSSIHSQDEDLLEDIQRGLTGGPSIIFSRLIESGETFLNGDLDRMCQAILGMDANALYMHTFRQRMPVGGYVRRHAPDFRPDSRLYMRNHFDWLDWVSQEEKIEIQHARNGGEVRVGNYKCDGFCHATNTAYEMDGCEHHGCESCNKTTGDHAKKLENTKKRREFIEKKLGTKMVVMKECEFIELKKQAKKQPAPNLHTFCEERLPEFYAENGNKKQTEESLLRAVRSGKLYGFLEADMHVPEHLHSKFEAMPPFFGTTDIPFKDIGEDMQKHVKECNSAQKDKKLLIGAMKVKRMLVHSDLLQWYLQEGIIVTKIYQVIEFKGRDVFKNFVEKITNARRDGDRDAALKALADICKLLGNAAYGSIIMNKGKHVTVEYTQDVSKVKRKVNDPRFKQLCEILPDSYEIHCSKKSVQMDLPLQLGFTILQLAKKRMLEFYYNFMRSNLLPNSYQLAEMDTDSLYFGLSGKTIEDVLKDDATRAKYRADLFHHCNDQPYGPDQGKFFPRDCCPEHRKFDSRTPGLFKLEASGVAMVCLNSKTYALKQEDGSCKFSCKGLNKRMLADAYETMKQVLITKQSYTGTNAGLRMIDGEMCTYEQDRAALTWSYWKRQVQPDGSTKPLPTVIDFWPSTNVEVVDKNHPLYPDRKIIIHYKEHQVGSIFELAQIAMKQKDPLEFMKGAVPLLPERYDASRLLVFAAEGEFRRAHKSKNNMMYWTSGMNSRASRKVKTDLYPGQNLLGQLWN